MWYKYLSSYTFMTNYSVKITKWITIVTHYGNVLLHLENTLSTDTNAGNIFGKEMACISGLPNEIVEINCGGRQANKLLLWQPNHHYFHKNFFSSKIRYNLLLGNNLLKTWGLSILLLPLNTLKCQQPVLPSVAHLSLVTIPYTQLCCYKKSTTSVNT